MSVAVKISELHKHFGATHALRGISLDIRLGEFFGLLGPNGAGKSTLINTVAGLNIPDAGSAAVMGYDVVSDYRNARQNLGVVPQELVYDPFFEVRSLLRIQAGYYGCGKDYWPWIDHLLERLELADKATSTMRQLSGGMKRRVLIAQALVHKPPVVILDEPTAGVDVELRRALWSFTRDLHAEGHTIVLTTHYLEEAEALCDRIGILNHGELIALEGKNDLLNRHPFRFLRLTLEGEAELPADLQQLVVERKDASVEFCLPRDTHPIGRVLERVRDAGMRVADVKTREPTLEDIFVELTADDDTALEAA